MRTVYLGVIYNIDAPIAAPTVVASASHAAAASVQQVEPLRAILATAAVRRVALPRPASYTHPLRDTGSTDTIEIVDIFEGLEFETGTIRGKPMAFALVVPVASSLVCLVLAFMMGRRRRRT